MSKYRDLRGGVGRTDITPPPGTLLMGYPDPYGERKATAVRDPLHATALVLDNDGHRAALVSLDTTIVDDPYVEAIRRGAEKKTGIPWSQITVGAIQTHSAPRTVGAWGWGEADFEYVEGIMVPGAIEAIARAAASMRPARMGIGVTDSEVGVNRREIQPDHSVGLGQYLRGMIDPAMTVLRFETAAGTLASLVHYGAHPTVLGGDSTVISRDWPGIMIDRMEQYTGAPALFVNGAVGDIAPRTNSMGAIGDGEAALWETGGRAAMDAMRAWRSIKDFRDVGLHVLTRTFELPYRALPSLEKARQQLKRYEAVKDQPGAGMAEYLHWQAVIREHDGAPQSGKPYSQILTALGPVVFVPFPGEPFAETVLRLRDCSPFQHTLCASTSCGNNGYFCTRESLPRGGYEAWIGKALGAYLLAENIDDVLVAENLALLQELYATVYAR